MPMARKVKSRFVLILSLIFKFGISAAQECGGAFGYVSNPNLGGWDNMLQEVCVESPDAIPGDITRVIHVDSGASYQEMSGFGASLSDSSAYLIHHSPARDEIIRKIFHPTEGIGLNLLRVPFDGSDFMGPGTAPYTYYEEINNGDPDLNNFSIDRDRAYILPVLKSAVSANPELKLMASPWSAPKWMKYPPYWNTEVQTLSGGLFIDEFTDTYAKYWVKFLQAYRDEGVPFYALTLQNEPAFEADGYPSMLLRVEQQKALAKALRAQLDAAGLSTLILIHDHNWDIFDQPLGVMDDPEAKAAIAGSAFHCYGGDYQAPGWVHDAHPDKDIFFTECTGMLTFSSWEANFRWNMHNLFIGQTRVHSKSVLLWNLALDENGGPTIQNEGSCTSCGCKDCRGAVSIQSQNNGSWWPEVEYFLIGHFSKFVRYGAVRIDSDSFVDDIESVAFRNPDGSVAVVIADGAWGSTKDFAVVYQGRNFVYRGLASEGGITLVIS